MKAELPIWGAPRSFIDYSKKQGTFAGTANVQPNTFQREGHLVEFRECWLQNTGSNNCKSIYFVLNIDGKLQHAPNDISFDFDREDGDRRIAGISQQVRRTKWGLIAAFTIGVKGGYVVHGIEIADLQLPAQVRLRVGTFTNDGFVPSDLLISFEICAT